MRHRQCRKGRCRAAPTAGATHPCRIVSDTIRQPAQSRPSSMLTRISSHWLVGLSPASAKNSASVAFNRASSGFFSGNSSGSRRCSHGSTRRSSVCGAGARLRRAQQRGRDTFRQPRIGHERSGHGISRRQGVAAQDARKDRRHRRIEAHLQCTDIVREHDVRCRDHRVGVDCDRATRRPPAPCALVIASIRTEMHRRRARATRSTTSPGCRRRR